MRNSRLRALSGVLAAGALVAGLSGTAAQASESTATAVPAEIGIRFNPDGDAGQCGGLAGQQWAKDPDFTKAIRFDTDSRSGGCQLSFGIFDPDSTLRGVSISYGFRVTSGGDEGQCGNPGTHQMPIQRFRTFGPQVRVDTDGRSGGCDLTFTVSGRSDVILEVRYFADGDGSQCGNPLPSDQNHTAFEGSPVTIGIDTDGRSGGCQMQLHLQQV